MEEFKRKSAVETNDKEIIFSKSVKAGKRIYYMDVKKNRKDEMFLAITESKKIVSGEGEESLISFEKHKIFLYKEDFEKFINGLDQVISFINQTQANSLSPEKENDLNTEDDMNNVVHDSTLTEEIKIDIDF